METLIGLTLLAALIGAIVGVLLPRFSVYFLGPLLLIIALLAAVTLMRTNLHTDGSPAGLVVGGVLVVAIAVGGCSGIALLAAGILSLKKRGAEAAPPPPRP